MADSDLLIHTGRRRDDPDIHALKDAVDATSGVMGSTLLGAPDVCTVYVRFESRETAPEELVNLAHRFVPEARLVGV